MYVDIISIFYSSLIRCGWAVHGNSALLALAAGNNLSGERFIERKAEELRSNL